MKQYHLTVDVYADWETVSPRYRIYVDNDLLTERDFIWDSNTYICENIFVNLEYGKHVLRIDHVNSLGKISVKNVTLDGNPSLMEFTV